MFAFVVSQIFAILFMKLIFVARNALDAYFINSALYKSVEITGHFKVLYNSLTFAAAISEFEPITILSGSKKSLIACPSRRNSGLLTTSNRAGLFKFLFITFSTSSPVPMGTVLLLTIIFGLFIFLAICDAATLIWERSVLPSLFDGVATHIKIISL